MDGRLRVYQLFGVLGVLVTWIFLLPSVSSLSGVGQLISDGLLIVYQPAAIRTLVFAFVTALFSTLIGFCVSTKLIYCKPTHYTGILLSILLLPSLVGNVSIAFVVKMIFLNESILHAPLADRSSIAVFLTLTIIQLWQSCTLAIYLFWLRFQSLSKQKTDFSKSCELSHGELVRDVIWPHARELAAVIFLMIFFMSTQTYAVGALVFKVSQGTESSFFAHRLLEIYHTNLMFSPLYAKNIILANSLAAVAFLLPLSGIAVTIFFSIQKFIINIAGLATPSLLIISDRNTSGETIFSSIFHSSGNNRIYFLVITLTFIVISPFVAFLIPHHPELLDHGFEFLQAIFWSFPGAIASAFFACLLAFLLRIGFPRELQTISVLALLIVVSLMALKAFPVLGILLIAYDWTWPLLGSGSEFLFLGWTIGHVIINLPFLTAFAIWINHRVSIEELEFQYLTRLNIFELARHSFISRFRLDYILVLVFAWSFVWNEGVINRATSDRMPSLIAQLAPQIGARPDYSQATTLVLLSSALTVVTIILWTFLVIRDSRMNQN